MLLSRSLAAVAHNATTSTTAPASASVLRNCRPRSFCAFRSSCPSLMSNHSLFDRGIKPSPAALEAMLAKKIRPYFYYIDIHGQLFLQDTHPKDLTSCFKDPRFLDFFVPRIRPNTTPFLPEYPWQSPCGKEFNFVEAEDTPIVFHSLIQGQLRWAGTRETEFKPDQLCISASTGRIYHPLPSPFERPDNSTVPPHAYTHGLIKSSLALSEMANDLSHDSFHWRGETFPLQQLP
ncbi:hypothetical protein EMPS_08554 [Entomortierella parvispora]|uniref:Uncharacterized protein n=1 Tax=Entomortierella parvispora TaxID=205924 RepID=A0A9P3LZQ9_9FUNG|nr:hypothetical protein EMPS_08554 [Entomortierella parvispora]